MLVLARVHNAEHDGVLIVMTMNSVVFQVVILCGLVTARHFGGTYHFHQHG